VWEVWRITSRFNNMSGNDVREILSHMQELPNRIAGFMQNYPQIIDRILEVVF
jgi:hypothetical protein